MLIKNLQKVFSFSVLATTCWRDGGDLSNGGIDPGLLFTRKVFKLSYDANKMSIGRQYLIPDQVSFAPRSSYVTTTKKEVFSGSKSYEKKLTVDVSANGKEQY